MKNQNSEQSLNRRFEALAKEFGKGGAPAISPIEHEIRFTHHGSIRSERSGKTTFIRGYAATFGKLSANLGGFREKILPGAFTRVLREKQDVRMLVDHVPSQIIGRTEAGTLELTQDPHGLFFRCAVADTTVGRDLLTSLERGDLSECSFGFIVGPEGQRWRRRRADDAGDCDGGDDEDDDCENIRELVSIDRLLDTSVVSFPAYGGTQAGIDPARSLWPNGVPAEVRMHLGGGSGQKVSDRSLLTAPIDSATERLRLALRLRVTRLLLDRGL